MRKKETMKLSSEEKARVQMLFAEITKSSPKTVLVIHSLLEETMKYLDPLLVNIYKSEYKRQKAKMDKRPHNTIV